MLKHREFPPVLFRKWILTLVVGVGCLGIGGAYYLFAGDRILLALSGFVFVFGLWRSIAFYRLIAQENYEVVEGTCVGIANKPLRKCRQIKIMDVQGVESSLLLSKQAKLRIGFQYRFYFKKDARPYLGREYIDTALSTDCFLGFEEMGAYPSESAADTAP